VAWIEPENHMTLATGKEKVLQKEGQ